MVPHATGFEQIDGAELAVPMPSASTCASVAVIERIRAAFDALVCDGLRPPVVVACSGGADSSALAIALATHVPCVLGHVVHDVRSEQEHAADEANVRALGERLGVPAHVRRVSVEKQGNIEANARRVRYEGLASIADEVGGSVVATGHHADDQLETVLMALVRGAGLGGLSGMEPQRSLPGNKADVQLLRPLLAVSHDESELVCRAFWWAWSEDVTNQDTRRLRSAIRATVLPILRERADGFSERLQRTTALVREAAEVVADQAAQCDRKARVAVDANVDGQAVAWSRDALREVKAIILGELLVTAAVRLLDGVGRDRIGNRQIDPVSAALRGTSGERRVFQWSGVDVVITKTTVVMQRTHRVEPIIRDSL